MSVGKRIREARTRLGLSQPEASSKSGIPLGTLRKYEHGSSLPGAEAITGFVRLGVNSNWLLTGEGPMLLQELHELEGAKNLLQQAIEQREELAASLARTLQNQPGAESAEPGASVYPAAPPLLKKQPVTEAAVEMGVKVKSDDRPREQAAAETERDRRLMLEAVLRTMEHKLAGPVDETTAARIQRVCDQWGSFAAKYPELQARLLQIESVVWLYLPSDRGSW